ncbi:AAC(3) family N-acetyltransferase [Deinococcus sonorensis]|uniref:Aminoglycoside N(3)-acetyltransferase n=2 Tax=Deinococcus sonorensis TaxID=309891 RepID=A0AAU7U671_9DEIO
MSSTVTRETLIRDLQSLGVHPGLTLMVHASLRRLGPVEGGADAALDALFSVVGPTGTVLMLLAADDRVPFDSLASPADPDVGVLAERFRTRAGTRVNDHAAARFGASGPGASGLLEPAPLHDYYGPGSVLERFVDADGQVLRLGADPDTVTLTHWAEYRADIPGKRRARRRYVHAELGEQWIEGLDDTDGIREWSGGDYFPQILLDFLAQGHARTGTVGHCTAELFSARAFTRYATGWIETHLAAP